MRNITIFIPALNEEENLQATIDRLKDALAVTVEDYQIIIINDGSIDLTGKIADQISENNIKIHVLHNKTTEGLGLAYSSAVRLANKDNFVYIPGDNSWPYRSLVELFGNMGKAEIVTSFPTNPEVRPMRRRLITMAYTRVINILFNKKLKYYNGLTIYPIGFVKGNSPTTAGFGFQADLLLRGIRAGYSYIELPLPIDERALSKSSPLNFSNIFSVLKIVVKHYLDITIYNAKSQPITDTNEEIDDQGPKLKNIVISGASSGIGRELARSLANDGHSVFCCGRSISNLRETKGHLESVRVKACDVTNEEEVIELVKEIELHWDHVDVLINCAGGFGAIGPIVETNSQEWLETIKVNLYGPYIMSKHFLALLSRSSSPKILNFSGGGAFNPFPNYSAYSSAKAALVRFTETIAIELAPKGVQVLAVAPGNVATNAHAATLKAGPKLAGEFSYQRAVNTIKEGGGVPMSSIVDCIRRLISKKMTGLTGKTISANFDPWSTNEFVHYINEINSSDLYTMRRVNIVNLPKGKLREVLSKAWSNFGTTK
jgi:NAD(P)-dependent dehydrogenase (short-subunit alcohol dehydrogenase family)/glycosyltransferase involved in cell wall biosynthesis